MEPSSHKKPIIIGLLAIIVVALAIALLYGTGVLKREKVAQPVTVSQEEISKLLSPLSAYEITLARAREWKPDAMLAQSNSVKGKTDTLGHSDDWEFLFISDTTKGKGYQIIIENRMITKSQEVPFVGEGTLLPTNLVSQEEAIAYVHSLKGYENQQILSIELYYNKDAGEWRWGVKTSKGTVSFKASQ